MTTPERPPKTTPAPYTMLEELNTLDSNFWAHMTREQFERLLATARKIARLGFNPDMRADDPHQPFGTL